MKVIYYKLSCETKIRYTHKSDLTVKNVFFDVREFSKELINGDVTLEYIKTFEGSSEEIATEKEKLEMKYNPKIKKVIYNQRYYKKKSADKYECPCGSSIINRKQIIDRHNQTAKHQKYVNNLK